MDCARCVELLSDVRDGLLEEPLCGEAARHLAACGACASLLQELDAVAGALSTLSLPLPAGLVERVAEASWRSRSAAPPVGIASLIPRRVLATAAGLTLAVSGVVFGALRAHQSPDSLPGRYARKAVNAAVAARERGIRLAEDVRILRLVVGTAFEGRVDRVNDRVDDYRRLLEKRRPAAPPSPHQSSSPNSSNLARAVLVKGCEAVTTKEM
jgi:hypothetical protein